MRRERKKDEFQSERFGIDFKPKLLLSVHLLSNLRIRKNKNKALTKRFCRLIISKQVS